MANAGSSVIFLPEVAQWRKDRARRAVAYRAGFCECTGGGRWDVFMY